MIMSVSLSMTIYLARDFAKLNKKLQDQLQEIKHLFEQTVHQENEKKQILENQKEDLERRVKERTEEVVRQKGVIEQKNKDIFDNLQYARRIQEVILPDLKMMRQTFPESFIIYLPKDIVSGDFYFYSLKSGKVIIAAADCTGHGVTGAFMSMIGSSILNQVINEKDVTRPADILNDLNTGITLALRQNEKDVSDGMDIAIISIDLNTMDMQFAGANRPLWLFRQGSLMEIKPDKSAIGGLHKPAVSSFTNHGIPVQAGDTIYLFSDGFADQFGGHQGRKMLSKNFKEFLASVQLSAMAEQESKLLEFFNLWKGTYTQVDDVMVIGVRV
jgi:serine phosphatase RsbU (regulator of sigma subunit)